MTYHPDTHHRRSIRLPDYDYSSDGAYFITICTQGRLCLYGDVVDAEMHLNDAGRMVIDWWLKLPDKFTHVAIDEYVIMPNHFHGIIRNVVAPPCGCPDFNPVSPNCNPVLETGRLSGRPHGAAPTVGDVMGWFKTMTTNAYIRGVKQSGWPPFLGRLWQRNYYERIIRDNEEFNGICEYIRCNPANWDHDEEKP